MNPQKGETNGNDRCLLIISTGQLEHSLVSRALHCSQGALEKLGPSFSCFRNRLLKHTEDLIKYKGCLKIETSSSKRDFFWETGKRLKLPQYSCTLELQLQRRAQFKLARSIIATDQPSPPRSSLSYPSAVLSLVLAPALGATVLWLKLRNGSKAVGKGWRGVPDSPFQHLCWF